MKKSTHRGFRGPNNFLLARRTFLYRNRTSNFSTRIDRCRCLDRSRCSKTIENVRKNLSVCYMSAIFSIVFLHSAFLNIVSSLSVPFHFTVSPQSSLRPSAFFHFSFFPSFCLFFSPPFPFLFFSFLYSRDKFKCALATREKLV